MAATPPSGLRNDVLLPDAVRQYIVEHKLEKVVTSALNRVILQMPEDPYARLAEELSKSSFSVPRFQHLRPDASKARKTLTFHVVVASRGVSIRIHKMSLGDAIHMVDGTEEHWISFLQDFFAKAFGDIYVDEYLSFHEKCYEHLLGAPDGTDLLKVTQALTNQLLLAGAASCNLDVFSFIQHCLTKAGCEQISPALRKPEDVAAYRDRWPSLAVPLFHGGHGHLPNLRCAVALHALSPEGEPSMGMLAAQMQALHAAKTEAVKGLQADKTTASLVVDGIAHVLPTLLQTFQACKKAIDAVAEERPSHGILFAYAEEAWKEEEAVYELETGKPRSLEELVEFYAELTEDGWITTLINPFRDDDFQSGCELLKASRPQLMLIRDYGDAIAPEIDEDTPFGCFWHLRPQVPLPSLLRRYADHANSWSDLADGFGHCCLLDLETEGDEAPAVPEALMEAILACGAVQTIYVPRELPEALVTQLSTHLDEMLLRVQALEEWEEAPGE